MEKHRGWAYEVNRGVEMCSFQHLLCDRAFCCCAVHIIIIIILRFERTTDSLNIFSTSLLWRLEVTWPVILWSEVLSSLTDNTVITWLAISVVTLSSEVNIKSCKHESMNVCVSQSRSQILTLWMWEVMSINAGANHSHSDCHSLTPFRLMSNWLAWVSLSAIQPWITEEEQKECGGRKRLEWAVIAV